MLILAFFSSAKTPVTQFERFSLEQGLSQVSIFTMIQDNKGFLWLGTQDGLNRFDGYNFKVFHHDPDFPGSISNNNINTLYMDSANVLWVGTNGGGLSYLDTKTETFVHFKHDDLKPNSLSDNIVWAIIEESPGIYLIGTENGLNRFNILSGEFDHFKHNIDDPDSLSANRISALYKDSRNMVWVGTYDGGLNSFNLQEKKFTRYKHEPLKLNSLSNDRINAILEDSEGLLWVGTENGLNRFDIKNNTFTQFKSSNKGDSLSHNNIRTLAKDRNGILWVGTEGGGLNRHNIYDEGFTHYKYNVEDVKSLSTNNVLSLFEDAQGSLWIGSQGAGVSKMTPQRQRFGHFVDSTKKHSNSGHDIVMAISKGIDDSLWLGTANGVTRYLEDGRKSKLLSYVNLPDNHTSVIHKNIWAIEHDDQYVWLGTKGAGLARLNTNSGKLTHFINKRSDPNSLSSNDAITLLKDHKGTLWVGTLGGGLNRFNPKEQNFQRFLHIAESSNSLSNNMVTKILDDGKNSLWIGTLGGGLNHFKYDTEDFTTYKHSHSDSNSLSDNSIFSLYKDLNDILWIGTKGGLNKFDLRSKKFTRYREKQGLANDTVYGILEGNQKDLWLSTGKGLSHFNSRTESFKNYNVNDGLQSNEFNIGAYFKSKEGELFFGGINGFNRFFPKDIQDDNQPPNVVLTDMMLLNKPVPVTHVLDDVSYTNTQGFTLDKVIGETKAITLTHQDNIIAFEFTALHFTNPKKNQYAYQLVGWDKDWVSTSYKNRRATYTNLPYGDYTFKVKASNADGYWNKEGVSLKVTVLPPPWKTWWAYTVYVMLLLGLVFVFIRSQRQKVLFVKEINAQLEQKVAERTRELQKANQKLEEISLTDQLTGLKNRRFLLAHIKDDIKFVLRKYRDLLSGNLKSEKNELDLLFFLIDLDHFKEVNDVYGHTADDEVLIQIKTILKQVFRDIDYLVRLGGEEFLVVVRFVDRVNAPILAERLRKTIEQYVFDIGHGKTIKKTCSIGYASFPFLTDKPDALGWERIIDIADHCLFAAKKSSRNAWIGLENLNCTDENLFLSITDKTEELVTANQLSVKSSLYPSCEIKWN